MTVSGSVTGALEARDNLKPEMGAAFIDYLTRATKRFRDEWKIEFDTLTPLNEPAAAWWKMGNHQEGAHIDLRIRTRCSSSSGGRWPRPG
jgi:hypothetical protein